MHNYATKWPGVSGHHGVTLACMQTTSSSSHICKFLVLLCFANFCQRQVHASVMPGYSALYHVVPKSAQLKQASSKLLDLV